MEGLNAALVAADGAMQRDGGATEADAEALQLAIGAARASGGCDLECAEAEETLAELQASVSKMADGAQVTNELGDEYDESGMRKQQAGMAGVQGAMGGVSDDFVPRWADDAVVAGDPAAALRAGVDGAMGERLVGYDTNDLGLRKTGYEGGIVGAGGALPMLSRVTGMGGDSAPADGEMGTEYPREAPTTSSSLHAGVMAATGVAPGTVAAARAGFGENKAQTTTQTLAPGLELGTHKWEGMATGRVSRIVYTLAHSGTGPIKNPVRLTLDFSGSSNLELGEEYRASAGAADALKAVAEVDTSGGAEPEVVAELRVVQTTLGGFALKTAVGVQELPRASFVAKKEPPKQPPAAPGAAAAVLDQPTLVATCDFAPAKDGQIALAKGDELTVLPAAPAGGGAGAACADGLLLVRNARSGETGLVPDSPAFTKRLPSSGMAAATAAATTTTTTKAKLVASNDLVEESKDGMDWGANASNDVKLADGREGLLMGSADGVSMVQIPATGEIVEVPDAEVTAVAPATQTVITKKAAALPPAATTTTTVEAPGGGTVKKTTTYEYKPAWEAMDGLRVDPRSGKQTRVKTGQVLSDFKVEEVEDLGTIPSAFRAGYDKKVQEGSMEEAMVGELKAAQTAATAAHGGEGVGAAGQAETAVGAVAEAVDGAANSAYGEKMAAQAAEQAAAEQAAKDAATAAAAAGGDGGSSGGGATFALAALQSAPFPDGVDAGKREQYLDSAAFQELFGMDKAAFDALPGWKRTAAKKKHGLF